MDLPTEALEAFQRLKAACLQAPILAFPNFDKPFLLETDASGKGLRAVLSQKQADGCYHPIAYASRIMNDTEQRYHSNKQEFLALKWAVTDQFHEYLSPYGKNRNEFVVRTDNNPLTYIFSSMNLDAANYADSARFAHIALESREFRTLRTIITTYVIDFQISDHRQRTQENWSESTRFCSIRPLITRITRIPRILQ